MQPLPLLAFALRQQLIAIDAVIDLARTEAPPNAAQLSWGLASSLDDASLVAIANALRSRGVGAYAIQRELIARGRFDAALGNPPDIAFDLFEEALPSLGPDDRARWVALVVQKLLALLAAPNSTTRKRLAGAKAALRDLPLDAQKQALAMLDAGYADDIANNVYAELDLAYGDIDPTLELARTHASVGSLHEATSLLVNRESRWPRFFNGEEAVEAARLVGSLPREHRDEFEMRFQRWAEASERGSENEDVCEVRWLAAIGIDGDHRVAERMLSIVNRARMAEALAEMAHGAKLTSDVREALDAKLVDLAEGYVRTLREVTSGGRVSDWARHATAVRQLRSSVTALTREGAALAPALEGRLHIAARSWSSWITTQDIRGDSLPYVYTAIAFARRFREEIPEAIEAVAKLSRGATPLMLEFEGWEALWSAQRAIEIARTALSG